MQSVEPSPGPNLTRRPEKDFWDILYGEGAALGPRRRSILFVIVAAGILTFFVPLMTTDPPVLGKAHWSLFNMALRICQGRLPPSHTWQLSLDVGYILFFLDPVIIYSLMLCLLAVLYFPALHRHMAAMAAFGAFTTVEMWRFMADDFEVTFYGHASYNGFLVRHVGLVQLVMALLTVFGSALYVLVHVELDRESPQQESQVRAILDAQSLLDAEIISEDGESGLHIAEILPPEQQAKHPRSARRFRD